LLSNPDHRVSNPVDVSDFKEYLERNGHGAMLIWSVITLILVIIIFIIVLKLLGYSFSS